MNFADVIVKNGRDPQIRDRVFILFRDEKEILRTVSYEDFYEQSLTYGNLISRLKLEKGLKAEERFHVGVFMQNIPEFFFILGGCAFTNSTLVGVNNAQVGEKLAFDLNNIDTQVLFVDEAKQPGTEGTFLDTVLRSKQAYGFTSLAKEYVFVTGCSALKEYPEIRTVQQKLDECSSFLEEFKPETLNVTLPAVIIFTSGTTGAPKGIEVTWQKLYDTGVNGTKILSYTPDDVGYVCMPVNHSNSLYLNIMPAMLNGSRILLRRRFSVRNFVKDIEDVGATVWNCVGDPVQYVINHINSTLGEQADFSHLPLRTVISTGTNAMNRAIFTRMFGLDIFTEVYGSTEAGAITAVDSGTPEYSVGKLLKDIRIVNEANGMVCVPAEVDAGGKIRNLGESAGEIVVSQKSLGASAFSGYYRLPEESARKLIPLDGEDFYRMGDLGAIVEKNGARYLVFLGRTGDWIRYKGENWTPVDGERIVGKYEGISNVGIIGVPQATGREDDPMYILEVKEPALFDIGRFYAFCKENLPHYMIPRFIRLMKSVPMTDTMKLKKSVLKMEFYHRSADGDRSEDDIIYLMESGQARRFSSDDYLNELDLFIDATNRDTLIAYTKRTDLFTGRGI